MVYTDSQFLNRLGPPVGQRGDPTPMLDQTIAQLVGPLNDKHHLIADLGGVPRSVFTKADLKHLQTYLPSILEGFYTSDLHRILLDVLPLHISDDIVFVTETEEYVRTLPEQLPAFGVAHQMEIVKSKQRSISKRFGIQFLLDRDYILQPEGQADMIRRVMHLGNSFKRLAEFIAMQRLLSVPPSRFNRITTDKWSIDEYEKEWCVWRDTCNALQKDPNGYQILCKYARDRIVERGGREPKYMIGLDDKSLSFLYKPEMTQYYLGGDKAVARLNNENGTANTTMSIQGMEFIPAPKLDGELRLSNAYTTLVTGDRLFLDDVGDWDISVNSGVQLFSQQKRNYETISFLKIVDNLPFFDTLNWSTPEDAKNSIIKIKRILASCDPTMTTLYNSGHLVDEDVANLGIEINSKSFKFPTKFKDTVIKFCSTKYYNDPSKALDPADVAHFENLLEFSNNPDDWPMVIQTTSNDKLNFLKNANIPDGFHPLWNGTNILYMYRPCTLKEFFQEQMVVGLMRPLMRYVTSSLIACTGGREMGVTVMSSVDIMMGQDVGNKSITNNLTGWVSAHLLRDKEIEVIPHAFVEQYVGGHNNQLITLQDSRDYAKKRFYFRESNYASVYTICIPRTGYYFVEGPFMYLTGRRPGDSKYQQYYTSDFWNELYQFRVGAENYANDYHFKSTTIAPVLFNAAHRYINASKIQQTVLGDGPFGENGDTPQAASVRARGFGSYSSITHK